MNKIPLAWIFDPALERSITRRLFHEGTPFVGSRGMVPNAGDHRALELTGDRYILHHASDGKFALLSNICPHQKGLIIDPVHRGDARSSDLAKKGNRFSCPLHRFAYNERGELAFHPMYERSNFEGGKLCLDRRELMEWNGLLFPENEDLRADLADFPLTPEFDLSRYTLVDLREHVERVKSDVDTEDYEKFGWMRFLDNYQEITHVVPFHRGTFAQLVDCRKGVEWKFGRNWSMQYAKWNPETTTAISHEYLLYRETVLDIFGEAPKYGAIWAAIYPNVMIEWYPLTLVISSLWPLPGNRCRNVVEYYVPEEVLADHPSTMKIIRDAYNLTAKEDGEICDSTEAGRRVLWEEGRECDDHPHPTIDAGMIHFREWLHTHLSDIK